MGAAAATKPQALVKAARRLALQHDVDTIVDVVTAAMEKRAKKLKPGSLKGGKSEPASKAKAGEGGRFKAMKKKLGGKVRDPGAVAASIGRAKFGKKKFQAMAAKGKKSASLRKEAVEVVRGGLVKEAARMFVIVKHGNPMQKQAAASLLAARILPWLTRLGGRAITGTTGLLSRLPATGGLQRGLFRLAALPYAAPIAGAGLLGGGALAGTAAARRLVGTSGIKSEQAKQRELLQQLLAAYGGE